MEDRRFDEITKKLTTGASRRSVLRRAGLGVAGAFAAAAGLQSQAGAQTTCTCERGVQTCRTVTTTTRRETRTRSGRQSCEIGNSGRQGTQAGTFTEVFEITTTTTTTQRFQGCGNRNNPIGQPQTTTTTSERLVSSTFRATGPCNAGQGG